MISNNKLTSFQTVENNRITPQENKKNGKEAEKKDKAVSPNSQESELKISNPLKASESDVLPVLNLLDTNEKLEHVNPEKDFLNIVLNPLSAPEVLDSIAISFCKNPLNQDNKRIITSLILNPATADKTLGKIADFLIKQKAPDVNLLLTLASHENISGETLSKLADSVKDNSKLQALFDFCEFKSKEK